MSKEKSAPAAAPPVTTTQRSLRGLGVAVVGYLAAFGLLAAALLKLAGAATDVNTWLIGLLPAAVGIACALSSTADVRQYTVRLIAAAAMLPIFLLFWASSAVDEGAAVQAAWPMATWLWMTLAALLHAAAFVAMILVAGRLLTRVAAVAGVVAVAADELLRRLGALPVPAHVQGANTWRAELPTAEPARRHELLLRLNATTRSVHVQETLRTAGAKPQDANEADMRALGEAAFDPARPEAQAVFNVARQTTIIDAARLAQTPWPGDAVAWASFDAEGWVTLACAVVTRSGWRWEPALFGRNRWVDRRSNEEHATGAA